MTRREYFVQSTRYQFLKLIRETSVIDLNRTINFSVFQFAAYFKYAILNRYDPTCRIVNCYVCGCFTKICLLILIGLVNYYILSDSKVNLETLITLLTASLKHTVLLFYFLLKTGYSH